MANLGISLGAGTQSFMSTVNEGLMALQQLRDYKSQMELDAAMKGIPKVGDDDTSEQGKALNGEYQRLGLQVDDKVPTADRLAAVNQARLARGETGDFSLPAARKVTADDRAAAVAAALEKSGDPRNIALASQMRIQALQGKQMNLQMNRDQFADAARKAVFMAQAGDEQGAMSQVQNAYNNFFPDGGSIMLSKDGDHVAGNITMADGRKTTLRAANVQDMAGMAYSLSSNQAYEGLLQRQHQEKLADKQIAGHLEAARIGAGASIASANIHAGASIAAARIREGAENQRMAMLAPWYASQVKHLDASTAKMNADAAATTDLRAKIADFTSKVAADPTDPSLPKMALELGALQGKDALVIREEQVPDPNMPGQYMKKSVEVNKYAEMLKSMQPAPVGPDQLKTIIADITKKLGGKPATEQDLTAFAKKYDTMAGRPGTFAHSILPNLPEDLLRGPAAPTEGKPATPPVGIPPRQAIPTASVQATGGAAGMINPAQPQGAMPRGGAGFTMTPPSVAKSVEPTVNPAFSQLSNAQLNGIAAGSVQIRGVTPDQARLELDARMEAAQRRTRGVPGG